MNRQKMHDAAKRLSAATDFRNTIDLFSCCCLDAAEAGGQLRKLFQVSLIKNDKSSNRKKMLAEKGISVSISGKNVDCATQQAAQPHSCSQSYTQDKTP